MSEEMSEETSPKNGLSHNGEPQSGDLEGDSALYDKLLDNEFSDDELLVEQLLSNEELLESSIVAHRDGLMSVPDLLEQLISSPEDPDVHTLLGLSDLSRADAALVRKMWPSVPADRRQLVVTELVEFAEHDFSFHLVRFLQLMLSDEDAVVRAAAVAGLWNDIEPELVSDLLQLLNHDPVEDVQAEAARVLGGYILAGELEEIDSSYAMRVEQALLAIVQNIQEPVAIRANALESVSFSGEMGVRQLIEDAYYSAENKMRVSSLVAMGRSADLRWRSLVRAELQNPSRSMRTQAAIATGELENRDAIHDLLELLQDSSQDVRLGVIFALGRLGGKEVTNALQYIATNEDVPAPEAEAAKFALEEMPFYANLEGVPLFDETEAQDDAYDVDPWDVWENDVDLGLYEESDFDDDDDDYGLDD